MSSRQDQLSDLRNYIKEVDKEVTMILQSLQWDRKQLLQCKPKSTCKYDSNHAVPPDKLKEHEDKCMLKSQGYVEGDTFLPDIFDANANTVLKLTTENITDIINYASKTDTEFKRVFISDFLALKICEGNVASEPLTFERLQASYSADERRAIYDVVVNSRPACDDLADLAMTGEVGGSSQTQSKRKSKLALLAELRNMRRRRTKYRVAVRSRNYSDTLRGVIEAQMEMFNETQGHAKSNPHNQSDKHGKVKEEPSDNPPDSKTIENRNVTKERRNTQHSERRNTYDTDRRSKYASDSRNYSDNKRKRGNVYDKNSRCFDRDRRLCSAEERNKCDDNDRSRQERNKVAYREEIEARNNGKERNGTYIKEERDKYSSSSRSSSRYRESEREERYYKDKYSHDDRHRRERSEHKRYNDDQNNIKREDRDSIKEKRRHKYY